MKTGEFNELFQQHGGALVLYARQWCRLPEDAVQEAFVDLAHLKSVPECPVAWLYTATRRKAQNIARAESRRTKHQTTAASERALWFDSHAGPRAEEEVEALQSSLELLGAKDREVIVAKIWGNLSFQQLAQVMECSVGAVHRRYTEALARLKHVMTSHGSQRTRREVTSVPKVSVAQRMGE